MFNPCFTCNNVKHLNKKVMKIQVKIWDGVIYKDDCLDIDFVNYTKRKYRCYRSALGTIILDENAVKKAQKEFKPNIKNF